MKKQILNLGKALTRTDQKQVNGGGLANCSTYSGPYCYSDIESNCGSCLEYQALPKEHKPCVLVDYYCEVQ
ncbi:hypothetical protein C8N26_2558 [Tenacibaculum lutimaris]|uniref:Uncharacterized protein n=1 Tax=Tenacibaculum lutimaris TaxID=285258 RepID=A0A420DYM4_9FLAO|nr:hypothetical protein [Tenacibaculum lutimaris]RKF02911.1 hypothetical protein C8N26_2558 [Tenacibaculum lutimaris]